MEMLKHTWMANEFAFKKTNWDDFELRNLHRPDFTYFLLTRGCSANWRIRVDKDILNFPDRSLP